MSFARFECLPHGLSSGGELQLAEGQANLTNRVVPAEAVVVKYLQVDGSVQELGVGEPWLVEGLMGWWVGGLVGGWVGGWVNGLVGWWVGGLVG